MREDRQTELEENIQVHQLNKELVSRIYRELLNLNNKETTELEFRQGSEQKSHAKKDIYKLQITDKQS